MSPRADLFLGLATIPNVLKAHEWYRRTCHSGTEFVSPPHPTTSGQLYCSITTALGIRHGLWLKRPAHLLLFLITPECLCTRNPVVTVHWGQVPLAQSMTEKGRERNLGAWGVKWKITAQWVFLASDATNTSQEVNVLLLSMAQIPEYSVK